MAPVPLPCCIVPPTEAGRVKRASQISLADKNLERCPEAHRPYRRRHQGKDAASITTVIDAMFGAHRRDGLFGR